MFYILCCFFFFLSQMNNPVIGHLVSGGLQSLSTSPGIRYLCLILHGVLAMAVYITVLKSFFLFLASHDPICISQLVFNSWCLFYVAIIPFIIYLIIRHRYSDYLFIYYFCYSSMICALYFCCHCGEEGKSRQIPTRS